jgi:hypothetical protein
VQGYETLEQSFEKETGKSRDQDYAATVAFARSATCGKSSQNKD